ncbi:class I mannose-6-phosphate isomerase [Clostridium sediminicola]|uniref:type I phosphomannose isomerase catalytic subunit n=1 Tax=Clostridium sediminicola TaxID=3114879 RepID=UPI0031F25F57
MYPLKFDNYYVEKVWGGRDLEAFRSNLPEGYIGESWDVACHKNGMSIVENGFLKGKSLKELIDEFGSDLVGIKISKEWFPLLIKFLNTSDKLSVQVHPDDEYGRRVENDMGKTEVWHVVDAKEGATLIVGLKDKCTKEELRSAVKSGNLEEYMNVVEVRKGDTYFIKSGLIHTIGPGIVIAEIQQNSDTTYRFYDYNRGREIHVEKALDVIDLSLKGQKSDGLTIQREGYTKTFISLCKEFSLEKYNITDACIESSDLERFYIFTCVEGEGDISSKDGVEKINMGDSILIPATLGEYKLKGNMKLLKSYVPDVEKVKKEILDEIVK